MVRQRKKDSKTKRQAVLATVEAMERTRTPIAVTEVSRRAGVSPWLVRQEPLMDEIRNAQERLSGGERQGAKESNTASFRVERDLLAKRTGGSATTSTDTGSAFRNYSGTKSTARTPIPQSVRVQELTDQNRVLSQQASEATQRLHQMQQQLAAVSTDLDAAHAVNRSLMAELNRAQRNRART